MTRSSTYYIKHHKTEKMHSMKCLVTKKIEAKNMEEAIQIIYYLLNIELKKLLK